MSDMLSQAELDALLGNMLDGDEIEAVPDIDFLSPEDKDVLGEIGNINMGTAATTLFALLGHKVMITTPKVSVVDWDTLSAGYDRPAVGIKVGYREGLRGSNILILKDRDVKIIADLMMGGSGQVEEPVDLNDLDMSAIGEAMNQMVGSASTSLSQMIKKKVDIDTPQPFLLDFSTEEILDTIGFASGELIACVAFRMEIGDLIDSEIIQILPLDFAQEMVLSLKDYFMGGGADESPPPTAPPLSTAPPPAAVPPPAHAPPPSVAAPPPAHAADPHSGYPPPAHAHPPQGAMPPPAHAADPHSGYPPPGYGYPPHQQTAYAPPPQQNVQAVQFQSFDVGAVYQQKENMGIIMDVPLNITVELGRTHKKISEILEFTPGVVIELDKLAGEPSDILVNGKLVGKGEVVVIDENFAIRIIDIVNVEKRL